MKQKKQQKKQQLKPHFQIVIHSARPKTFNHLHLRKSFSKFRFQPVSTQFYLNYGKRIQVSACFQENFHWWKTRFILRKFFHHMTRSHKIFHWWEEFIHFTEFYKALPPSILLTSNNVNNLSFDDINWRPSQAKNLNKHRQKIFRPSLPFFDCRS